MRKKILEPVMLAGLFLSAFLCWYFLYRAVMVPDSSVWGAPITIFFILLVFFFMCTVFVRRSAYLSAVLAASLLLGIIFGATLLHFAFLILSAVVAYCAMRNIRESLGFSLRLSFINSFMSGRSYLVFALIIAICSQYYALVGRAGKDVNLPTFEISKNVALSLGKLYGHVNPKYSFFSSAREMTVDRFILDNQNAVIPGQDPERTAAALSSVLEQGRKQLSDLSGNQLSGSEQVADVFVDLATRKINNYFSVGIAQSGKSSPIPLFLTCVLFLTLLPLATIVGYAGTIFSALLCGVMLKKGVIKKKIRQVEAESLLL
jgi:hypothetical protein